MLKPWYPLALLLGIAVFGCSNADDAPSPRHAKSVSVSGASAWPGISERSIAEPGIRALADHLDVPPDAIEVDSVRAVDWRDSSLGCPQTGEAYLQVITPGHEITLRVDGRLYVVHEASGRAFVCTRKKPSIPETTAELELAWAPQAEAARRDVARRLGVDVSQVAVVAARRATWMDASLGCPEPGRRYPETHLDGFVLTLRHGGRAFTYHTDLDRVIACPPFTED